MSMDLPDTAEVFQAALWVSAARLDSGVTADEFAERVRELARLAYQAGKAAAAAASDEEGADEPDAGDEGGAAPAGDDDVPAELDAGDVTPTVEPPRRATGRPRKLSYDDKVRIRARYDEATEGHLRAPFGFISNLAEEYGVSVQTIRNVIRGD